MMQQMLMSKLQQSPQPQSVGGMQPQTGPMNAGAQLMQKIMLMKALQNAPQTPGGATGQQQRAATAGVPGTQAMINPAMSQNPQIQAMQQGMAAPLTPQQMQAPLDPSLLPTPGYS
jgi:hypothetical protein